MSIKREKIIEFLEQQLKFWKLSNDIYSPTHYAEIDECVESLRDVCSGLELENLHFLTLQLYEMIAKIYEDSK
jgi:hypothetical protein